MKVKVTIERGDDGSYHAHFSNKNMPFALLGEGKTAKEAIEDFYESHEEMREYYREIGKAFPKDVEYEFRYDIPSFLQYYAFAFTLAGLERITGVHQKQLGHYISGVRKPSNSTVRKIEERIHAFASDLSAVYFV